MSQVDIYSLLLYMVQSLFLNFESPFWELPDYRNPHSKCVAKIALIPI